ncbi:MAG: PHP domain-containing protein, partial [Calditrichales bacterium]
AIFNYLGLPYIAPALREDNGEIEAAQKGNLPALYDGNPFFGVFHVHTTYSDGAHSLAEIVQACQEMGHRYVGISDHSEAAFYANGLTAERLKEQHKEIDILNQQLKTFKIFKGIEVDILADGRLDFSDAVLAECDFVIASVHSQFHLPEAAMTQRICRAMENPFVTMLGHATGRLLLSRESYALNMETVIQTAARHGKMIEINASPYRLDLDWRWCKFAKAQGVMTSLNPDAHATAGLSDYNYGIGVARKGWLEVKDILNTYPTEEVQGIFKKTRT